MPDYRNNAMTKTGFSVALLLLLFTSAAGQQSQDVHGVSIPLDSYRALKWRMIGPFRGGRVLAVTGVPGEPDTFYFGGVGGGVWKTTDAGRVWSPVFDGRGTASIGALAVAPSNPSIIYAGAGEADMRSDISFGDGIYKSIDSGHTWTYLGLENSRQIGRIIIDPANPDIVLVAVLGHGFGPNPERGVFRSTDGGITWNRVLYKDENTGVIDVCFDPDNPRVVYAALWNVRRPPWNTYAPITGPGGGLYKSVDGGATWTELRGHGLPEGKTGRIGVRVAPGTNGRRIYALVDAARAGLYRSDDSGANWSLVGTDPRIESRSWYFSEVTVDPVNPEVVYVSNVSLYRSHDGGHTFQTIKGAPGGDDYHSLWIDPRDPRRMILGGDQGAVITVNGALTWSSWYNQPTAQFYHVSTDNSFPYFVYGAQQDSGTAAVASRGDYGQITFRDWHPVGAGESGYIFPDPGNPNIVYGGTAGGSLFRYSNRTGQVQDITPTLGAAASGVVYRYPWTPAFAVSPRPPYALYQGAQFLFRSADQGQSWSRISPDLTVTRPNGGGPKPEDAKALIYSVAPSPVSDGMVWVGTDHGLIKLTTDGGKNWSDVTPAGLPAWSMISMIEPSPSDPSVSYAVVDRHQVDDLAPYIYRTKDSGRSWTLINRGIPETAYVHVIRADPVRKGLLFAGTEIGVFVSLNDGDNWQPLQLNLPVASIRDLALRNNDLVAATHGRSFWILDDISPLRQIDTAASSQARLFSPSPAIRLRKSMNRDTPLPPETPAGTNPPAGAIIYYNLPPGFMGKVGLEVQDRSGATIIHFSSDDLVRQIKDVQAFPTYWLRPPAPLSSRPGLNRFVWDLRYPPPQALNHEYSISAVYGEDAPREPLGPLVAPGEYRVLLRVTSKTYAASLRVALDPRISLRPGEVEELVDLQLGISRALDQSYEAYQWMANLRQRLRELKDSLGAGQNDSALEEGIRSLDSKAARLEGSPPQYPSPPRLDLIGLNIELALLMTALDSADAAPPQAAIIALQQYKRALDERMAEVSALESTDIASLNNLLKNRKLSVIDLRARRGPTPAVIKE